MNNKIRGTVEMTVAMGISGTIGWFVVRSGQPIIDLLFWRCVFGALTLLIVCASMRMFRRDLSIRLFGWAALGGAAIVANWLLIFASFSRASISIATAVYNTQPFMLVGLGALFLSEKPPPAKLLWLVLAFGGVVLITQAQPNAGYIEADYIAGIFMALGAAFFYALAAIITKKLSGTPPHLITFAQVCVGSVLLAPFANLSHLHADAHVWSSFVMMGVVYTGLSFVLLYSAIQKLPTYLVGALSFLYPVIAIVVDYLAFDHWLCPLQLAGVTTILLAAAGMHFGNPGGICRRPN